MGEKLNIILNPLRFELMGELVLLIILLIGAALMSASEVAFFSLKPTDIEKLENKKTKKSLILLKLINNPDRLLANILVGSNLFNISIIILSTYFSQLLINFQYSPMLGFIIEVLIITFLILFAAEILPKVFAINHNIKVAMIMAYPLHFLSKLFFPITSLLISSTSFVQKKIVAKKPNISINDLSNALEITSASLTDERAILKGIVRFGNINVSEIMQPRLDIVAVDYNISIRKLFSVVVETGYSRIPVYEKNLDHIKGILYIKDLLPHFNETSTFKWQTLIKQAYYVPETKKIDDLLAEFQKNKTHLAIVIDEYGGTSGLVTMEDILEEIVGEISDESDVDEELLFKKLSQNIFLFEAKILLNDFYKITGINENIFDEVKGEYETLAGLILELKGEIPQKNDKIEYKNLTFIIEAADKRRIKQVKVMIK